MRTWVVIKDIAYPHELIVLGVFSNKDVAMKAVEDDAPDGELPITWNATNTGLEIADLETVEYVMSEQFLK